MGLKKETLDNGHHSFTIDLPTLLNSTHKILDSLIEDLDIEIPHESAKPALQSVAKQLQASSVSSSWERQTYYGKSIAVGDFNADGIQEVFVGAPVYGIPGYTQMGAVFLESDIEEGNY